MRTIEMAQRRPIPPSVARTPRVRLGRLIRVELRKQTDTRAGRWLLLAIALLTLAGQVIVMATATTNELTWARFVGAAGPPQAILLPVLGILLVTSEWGQRTAMVTYTLEPRRGRVSVAKLAAAILLATVFTALALGLAALTTAVAGILFDGAGGWDYTWVGFLGFTVLQLSGVVQGVALGMLFMNTAGAILFYFAIPTVWGIVAASVEWLADIGRWTDLNTTAQPLLTAQVTADDWLRFAVSASVWVLLPLLLGWLRPLRREVTSA